MEDQVKTAEQITQTITAARDSVWVIEDTITRLTSGALPSTESKSNIERNVGHLRLVVADPEVADSGQNIDDLVAAITAGEAKLNENIWSGLPE